MASNSSEPPSVAVSGDARYLTKLFDFGKGDELSQSATTQGFEVTVGSTEKMKAALGEDGIWEEQVTMIDLGFDMDDNPPHTMQTPSAILRDECSFTDKYEYATFNDAGEMSKQGKKRKRGSDDTMVLVTVTYREDTKSFRFPISLGLLKLKNKVAKRFKLKGKMIRLKYIDEDDDLILVCGDYDLEPAMVASGSENTLKLICKTSAD